jgi:glycosyltransferase involved in cell wall biosynthesis
MGFTISATMIVKNEEEILERCLRSLEGIDDIVILDTGSTDKTGEIAIRFTKKYFPNIYKWRDNFAEARNISLNLCTTDWVLVIDADEFMEEGAIQRLREFIATLPPSLRVIDIPCLDELNKAKHYMPRIWKRSPDITWKGRIHNYLSISADTRCEDVRLFYGYSKAHQLDPDRAFRILKKVTEEEPNVIREWFYLAREYVYRSMWNDAITTYQTYLKRAIWAPEMAEAYLQLSKCLFNVMKGGEAREACLDAIAVNTNFKDAIVWMAYISGPKNKERWLEFSETATDEDTLFGSSVEEMSLKYWDTWGSDGKYTKIYEQVGEWVGDKKVLDVGCGGAELSKYIKYYSGLDFSKAQIDKAKKIATTSLLWVGNAYDAKNYMKQYDVCTAIRLIEHVKDREFIQLIRKGTEFIFTVPSFPSGMRFYTDKSIRRRLGDLIDIQEVMYFKESPEGWTKAEDRTNDYVLLCKSRRK